MSKGTTLLNKQLKVLSGDYNLGLRYEFISFDGSFSGNSSFCLISPECLNVAFCIVDNNASLYTYGFIIRRGNSFILHFLSQDQMHKEYSNGDYSIGELSHSEWLKILSSGTTDDYILPWPDWFLSNGSKVRSLTWTRDDIDEIIDIINRFLEKPYMVK